jgi:hypothetical protein
MKNTGFANRIRTMTDSELDRQLSSAHNLLHGECYCGDDEARADAYQWHRMLAREIEQRRTRQKT